MPFGEITLNDGHRIPAIAFGTWKIPKEVTPFQVGQAIDVGFDHIDTAQGRSSDRSFLHSLTLTNEDSLSQRGGSRPGYQGERFVAQPALGYNQMEWNRWKGCSTVDWRKLGEVGSRVP